MIRLPLATIHRYVLLENLSPETKRHEVNYPRDRKRRIGVISVSDRKAERLPQQADPVNPRIAYCGRKILHAVHQNHFGPTILRDTSK